MKIPTSIKVAGITYPVVFKETIVVGGKDGYAGACNYFPPNIEISSDSTPERAFETLIHELIHVCLYEAGIKEHDEELVIRLTKPLYQVFIDNNLTFSGGEANGNV